MSTPAVPASGDDVSRAADDATVAEDASLDADQAVLMIAASDHDSDLYWATGFLVPDPMIFAIVGSKRVLLVKDLELGRAREQATVHEVVATSPYEERLRSEEKSTSLASIAATWLEEQGISRVIVPHSFPVGHARGLESRGLDVEVRSGSFFPARAVKTASELDEIRAAQRAAESTTALVRDILRASEIRGDQLWLDGEPLTSERVRAEAMKHLLDFGASGEHMIIAGGDQACDPHNVGTGPLPAHRTIIVDIFPRSYESRYWGDMTRTFVKGDISDEVRAVWRDVLDAQDAAFDALRADGDGRDVHRCVVEFFESRGRVTEERDGKKVGFFHGTGHGVGLDIHEAPSLGRSESRIEAGQVITVEPGLYYPGLAGVRIEDMVIVRPDGLENLNTFPKELDVDA